MRLASRLQKDYVVSNLRFHLYILKTTLEDIEQEERQIDYDFVKESIRHVEVGLRKLRKITSHTN